MTCSCVGLPATAAATTCWCAVRGAKSIGCSPLSGGFSSMPPGAFCTPDILNRAGGEKKVHRQSTWPAIETAVSERGPKQTRARGVHGTPQGRQPLPTAGSSSDALVFKRDSPRPLARLSFLNGRAIAAGKRTSARTELGIRTAEVDAEPDGKPPSWREQRSGPVSDRGRRNWVRYGERTPPWNSNLAIAVLEKRCYESSAQHEPLRNA